MGEIVKSKVKSVQANGTWNSQYGVLYKYEYVMEDGTVINANHKENKSYENGTEVEYEIKRTNSHGNSGNVRLPKEDDQQVAQTNSGSNSNTSYGVKDQKTQLTILAQSTLAKSVDIFKTGSLDEEIGTLLGEGKSQEDAIVTVLHSLTNKLMLSQIALVEKMNK